MKFKLFLLSFFTLCICSFSVLPAFALSLSSSDDVSSVSDSVGFFNKYQHYDMTISINANVSLSAVYRVDSGGYGVTHSLYTYLNSNIGETFAFQNGFKPFFRELNVPLSSTFILSSVSEGWDSGTSYCDLTISYTCSGSFDISSLYTSFALFDSVYNSNGYNHIELALDFQQFYFQGNDYNNVALRSVVVGSSSSNKFSLSFSVDSSSVFSIKSFAISMPVGFGDEDIYSSGVVGSSSYGVNLVGENVNSSFASSNSFSSTLFTFDSSYKISQFTFKVELPSLNVSKSDFDYPLSLLFDFGFFNTYPDTSSGGIVDSVAVGSSPDYLSCFWYDIPCHLGNAILYLLYEFPITKQLFTLFSSVIVFISQFFSLITSFSGLGVLYSFVCVLLVFFVVKFFVH